MGADIVRRIADAVLYEGYLLWPYRKSALKNQQRFTFGGVYPPAWEDSSLMQAQVLLRDDEDAEVEVRVRFLQMVERQVLKDGPSSVTSQPVEELEVDGRRWVSWDEAVEREIAPGPIQIEEGDRLERIPGGAIRRSWRALEGEVSFACELVRRGLWRITVRVTNTTPWVAALREDAPWRPVGERDVPPQSNTRKDALCQTFCSTHAVLRVRRGEWVSLTDPPDELRADAEACENIGVWPVLVGEEGDMSTMLASPIILSDHPEIAPESPGDLFDSGEIDQMLVLNILAMTDEERRDMRDSDPRAREILERTEALSDEQIMRLNGVVREFGLVRGR
ncbi:MAG TPA: hypothetical protein VIJ39_14305 [Solirubrobacteraceae bacterium]